MSKQVTDKELGEIVAKLLTGDVKIAGGETGRLNFMTRIAELACDFCGSEITGEAQVFDGETYIGIIANEHTPPGGGVWEPYDPDEVLHMVSVTAQVGIA